ncbi:MAG: DUF5060 domain-containing protein, partial [Chitinivibrionales bacterium]|nr:DUF5060 domain-containing protein [Chitinivibrionales bacterium]
MIRTFIFSKFIKKNMDYKLKAFIISFLYFILISVCVHAETELVSLSQEQQTVGIYKKFEIDFDISRSFPRNSFLPYYYYDPLDTPQNDPSRNSPYGVDGITIDAHFVSPSGEEAIVPAFYYLEFIRQRRGEEEVMTELDDFYWKVRFSPSETGQYRYYLTIQDKFGTSRYPKQGYLAFDSVDSDSKGFIRVSQKDPRFMEFDDGTSFLPIASGHQWWECCGKRSFDYEDTFEKFSEHDINFLRIWDQNDGYSLTVEGPYDAYNYPENYNPVDNGVDISDIPKGTQMNQRGNFEEDKIIEAAEKKGVYIQLCSHGDPYWIWDSSIYDESWNKDPASWTDTSHLNYWRRNFRYRVARWGYSTAVMGWETWNEHGHILESMENYEFYKNFVNYQKETDPYDHIVTTSQGSQVFDPGFWSEIDFDAANYHDYMMPRRYSDGFYNDAAKFVYTIAQCLRTQDPREYDCPGFGIQSTWKGDPKPIIWGELDTGTENWNEANPQPIADHNVIWAGLFSPFGMVPVDWYWDHKDYIEERYDELSAATKFFEDIDYSGSKFSYYSTPDVSVTSNTINTGNSGIRVLAMKSSDKKSTYAWVQNIDNTWRNQGSSELISAYFILTGLSEGEYLIEKWNTYTGNVEDTYSKVSNAGNLRIDTLFSKDAAYKIRLKTSTDNQESSPDLNNDGSVDIFDLSIVASNFGKTDPGHDTRADPDNNGRVDILDLVYVATHFSQEESREPPEEPADSPADYISYQEWHQD